MRDKPEQSKADPRMLNSRAQRALWFGARMIAGFVWWEMILVRFVGHERVDKNRLERFIALAKRFRGLAVELGGVWIKLGQFLSSRVDIFPPEIISALADLQDAVPPENTEVIVAQVERELGKPLDEIFAEFEPLPVAAASFGQAHRARFKTADGPLDPNT
ncbi:MAG TPA: AarF/UbiB family protein, partial [Thermoflexales bacterium]|nr:AarF/UbiB family protein [Thermoflexales bacterium]